MFREESKAKIAGSELNLNSGNGFDARNSPSRVFNMNIRSEEGAKFILVQGACPPFWIVYVINSKDTPGSSRPRSTNRSSSNLNFPKVQLPIP